MYPTVTRVADHSSLSLSTVNLGYFLTFDTMRACRLSRLGITIFPFLIPVKGRILQIIDKN